MSAGFEPGTETLRIPWGTPQPVRFHDAELDLDPAVRARGFAEVEGTDGEDHDELFRQIRMAAAAALHTQLETGNWSWSELENRREALEEAMEKTLADAGLRVRISIADIVPDEPSAMAIGEKRALLPGHSLPPAPVDSPMIDGPGAYPQGPGGFGLYRMGETPPAPEDRACPNCGRAEPFYANYCTRCGTRLHR